MVNMPMVSPIPIRDDMSVNTISSNSLSARRSLRNSILLGKRIWPVLLGHFTNDFYANILPALLPILLVKLDLSLALVGFLASGFLIAGSFAQLIFGVLNDRFRRFNFMFVGIALTGIFLSLAGLLTNYWLLMVAVAIAGLGTAMFHPGATAVTGALAPNQRGVDHCAIHRLWHRRIFPGTPGFGHDVRELGSGRRLLAVVVNNFGRACCAETDYAFRHSKFRQNSAV